MTGGDGARVEPTDPPGSVVIPAYNESENLATLLELVLPPEAETALEVAVVCNGCSDNTYEVAGRFSDRVISRNLQQPSKIAALNRGDRLVSAFPRIYLDADIRLSHRELSSFLTRMRASGKPAGGVRIRFDLTGSPYLVRAFYRTWSRLPYLAKSQSLGSGFYALSAGGRSRFGEFPDVIADDMFVDRLFSPEEKFFPDDVQMTVQAPKKLLGLIRIRSRAYAGSQQLVRAGLARSSGEPGTRDALLGLLRRPADAFPALVYLAVQLIARAHAKVFRTTDRGVWLRDESTRVLPTGSYPG